MHRVFLLSPANCGGRRAQIVMNPRATFPVAIQLHSPAGATLGDVFSFVSGLYFRGKMEYATAFADPPPGVSGSYILAPGAGLVEPGRRVTLEDLRKLASVPVDIREPAFTTPLEHHTRALAAATGPDCEIVLLGSVATGKYVNILSNVLGDRFRFPQEFVGRGDMSRGGLMLRCVDDRRQLTYVTVEGSARHGARPARLEPRRPVGQRGLLSP